MPAIHVVLLVAGLLSLAPSSGSAQDGDRQPAASASRAAESTKTVTTEAGATYTVTQKSKPEQPEPPGRWVRALTNVQVELTITDQGGSAAPEKKTVTMVVSSGSWGKIRSAGTVQRPSDAMVVVDLNVDARPFVSVDGPIQLELTMAYYPPGNEATRTAQAKPTGLNQSLTVVLQSGKPLVISQAADPVSDRKIVVEVKATVLK